MWLFVGLGNPGPKYAHTRHNIGFMAVDEIVRRHSFSAWDKKFQGEVSMGQLGDDKVLLLKPQTFMNLSGVSVQAAAAFYKIPPAQIVVFHDELDLAPGRSRAKKGGGAGGHNGLKSIDKALGQDYWRVRLGIGHPGNPDMVSSYVLHDFAKDDDRWLVPLLDEIGTQAVLITQGKIDLMMTRLAETLRPVITPQKEEADDDRLVTKKDQKDGI